MISAVCSICSSYLFESLKPEDVKIVAIKCGHCYHSTCLNEWLAKSTAHFCPVCRFYCGNGTDTVFRIYFQGSNSMTPDFLNKKLKETFSMNVKIHEKLSGLKKEIHLKREQTISHVEDLRKQLSDKETENQEIRERQLKLMRILKNLHYEIREKDLTIKGLENLNRFQQLQTSNLRHEMDQLIQRLASTNWEMDTIEDNLISTESLPVENRKYESDTAEHLI